MLASTTFRPSIRKIALSFRPERVLDAELLNYSHLFVTSNAICPNSEELLKNI